MSAQRLAPIDFLPRPQRARRARVLFWTLLLGELREQAGHALRQLNARHDEVPFPYPF